MPTALLSSPLLPTAPQLTPPVLTSLPPQLLVKDPKERLSLQQVEQDPWIASNADAALLSSGRK
jgi:hypothetical protein